MTGAMIGSARKHRRTARCLCTCALLEFCLASIFAESWPAYYSLERSCRSHRPGPPTFVCDCSTDDCDSWKGLALALDVVVSAILLFTMQRALPRFLHVLVVGLCALPTVPQAYVMWLSTSRIPNDAHGTPNTGIGRSKPGDYELSFLPMMLVGGFEVTSIVFHIAMIAGIAWYLWQRWNPTRYGELEILLS